jgi:hypothetical protein
MKLDKQEEDAAYRNLINKAQAGDAKALQDLDKLRRIDSATVYLLENEIRKEEEIIKRNEMERQFPGNIKLAGTGDEQAIKELIEFADSGRIFGEQGYNSRIDPDVLGYTLAQIFFSQNTKKSLKQLIWSKRNVSIFENPPEFEVSPDSEEWTNQPEPDFTDPPQPHNMIIKRRSLESYIHEYLNKNQNSIKDSLGEKD